MAFVEIKKKGKLTRYAVDVVYRINQTTKLGVLRFTKKGIDTLFTSFPQVTINKPFKIFIDKDNGELAFHNDPKGDFRITKSKKDQYAIFSTDLTKEIEKDSFYLLQHSKEYGFILVPVEDGKTKELPSPKPEVVAEPKEQPKVETAQTKVIEAVKEQPSTDKVETKSKTKSSPKAHKVAPKAEDKATSDKPKPNGRPKKNK